MKCVKPVRLGSEETRLGAVSDYNGHGKAISSDEIVSGDGCPLSHSTLVGRDGDGDFVFCSSNRAETASRFLRSPLSSVSESEL